MLWGAIVANAQNHDNVLDLLQTLVHESAHCILFGLGVDGALVEDDESKRYASPLRVDTRPMIGVYHATYVSARIHQALMRLRDRGNVNAQDRLRLESELLSHGSNYWDGMETIRSHANLTSLGESIMLGAERYMAGFQK
jgi:HEXXH motif-containing protein